MMRAAGMPDALIAVNGPQDGTEFALAGRLVHMGRDAACTVNLSLDNAVLGVHAELSPAGGGYRVRSLCGKPVYIDGKRAGNVKSRIAKSGSLMRVGHTEMILECAADGPASRSVGISLENDFLWALRNMTRRTLAGIAAVARAVARRPINLVRRHPVIFTTIALALAIRFIPFVRGFAYDILDVLKSIVAGMLA
jgi:FHA domain